MNFYFKRIEETVAFIRNEKVELPSVAIVLGTGLGNFSSQITSQKRIPYSSIPHFPKTTVKGHKGELIFGRVGGMPIVAQNGRYHFYEGYSMKEVTFPIRVFKFLGVNTLVIVSAVGGIHENFQAGDISVVVDHINFHNENPLTGPNDDRLGPRFPDMVDAYSPDLVEICHKIAQKRGIKLHNSVYAGFPGPNIETKAEYNFLHKIGATVVGMSTVPEVIVAKHMELRTCVLTAITNKCYPVEAIKKVTHDEVIRVAELTEKKITTIIRDLLEVINLKISKT